MPGAPRHHAPQGCQGCPPPGAPDCTRVTCRAPGRLRQCWLLCCSLCTSWRYTPVAASPPARRRAPRRLLPAPYTDFPVRLALCNGNHQSELLFPRDRPRGQARKGGARHHTRAGVPVISFFFSVSDPCNTKPGAHEEATSSPVQNQMGY